MWLKIKETKTEKNQKEVQKKKKVLSYIQTVFQGQEFAIFFFVHFLRKLTEHFLLCLAVSKFYFFKNVS